MTQEFRLRNEHRTRALMLAVERINAQSCKPLYAERAAIAIEMATISYKILADASAPYIAQTPLLDAGICHRTRRLATKEHDAVLFGTIQIRPEFGQTWPVLLEHSSQDRFLVMACRETGPFAIEMPLDVISFDEPNTATRSQIVPHASLSWALQADLKLAGGAVAELVVKWSRIRSHINLAIREQFAILPRIAAAIGACQTSAELVNTFPAAASLFEARPPANPADETARALLHTIS